MPSAGGYIIRAVRVQKEADLPDVRIHDLRHTFASLLVSGGAFRARRSGTGSACHEDGL